MWQLVLFSLFLSLVSGQILRSFGHRFDRQMANFSTASLFLSFLLSAISFWAIKKHNLHYTLDIFSFADIGTHTIKWQITLDSMSAYLLCFASFFLFLIAVYSKTRAEQEHAVHRLYPCLHISMFSAILLICAEDFVQVLIGAEGASLCICWLITTHQGGIAKYNTRRLFIVNTIGTAVGMTIVSVVLSCNLTTNIPSLMAQQKHLLHCSILGINALSFIILSATVFTVIRSAYFLICHAEPNHHDAEKMSIMPHVLIIASTTTPAFIAKIYPLISISGPKTLLASSIIILVTSSLVAIIGLSESSRESTTTHLISSQILLGVFAAFVVPYQACLFYFAIFLLSQLPLFMVSAHHLKHGSLSKIGILLSGLIAVGPAVAYSKSIIITATQKLALGWPSPLAIFVLLTTMLQVFCVYKIAFFSLGDTKIKYSGGGPASVSKVSFIPAVIMGICLILALIIYSIRPDILTPLLSSPCEDSNNAKLAITCAMFAVSVLLFIPFYVTNKHTSQCEQAKHMPGFQVFRIPITLLTIVVGEVLGMLGIALAVFEKKIIQNTINTAVSLAKNGELLFNSLQTGRFYHYMAISLFFMVGILAFIILTH